MTVIHVRVLLNQLIEESVAGMEIIDQAFEVAQRDLTKAAELRNGIGTDQERAHRHHERLVSALAILEDDDG